MEQSDGVSSTQTTTASDTTEDTENTTVLLQMEELKEGLPPALEADTRGGMRT